MHINPQKISNVNLAFETDAPFIEVKWNESNYWQFVFENGININAEDTLWRLLQNGKIRFISTDHMQQFGLPKPINMVEEITNALLETRLSKIDVKEDTGDLKLFLSNNYLLEFFITSSGYESYSFSINNHRYIGMGRGEIAVF